VQNFFAWHIHRGRQRVKEVQSQCHSKHREVPGVNKEDAKPQNETKSQMASTTALWSAELPPPRLFFLYFRMASAARDALQTCMLLLLLWHSEATTLRELRVGRLCSVHSAVGSMSCRSLVWQRWASKQASSTLA